MKKPGIDLVGRKQWLRRCLWNWELTTGPRRVWIAIADHYEPLGRDNDEPAARRRLARWRTEWPAIANRCRDAAGRCARYSFFYPAEAYRPHLLEPIADLIHAGLGDFGVHLHHGGESEDEFVDVIARFLAALERVHGLSQPWNGKPGFGFIHGDWALDNCRPEGHYCGLNNELTLLARLGCYADFTMPAQAPSAQARQVNQIYWAADDPAAPKSYDTGVAVRPGRTPSGDLMIIPGPFGVRLSNWWLREQVHQNLISRCRSAVEELFLEYGELASHDPVSPHRVRRWLALAPRIGRDIFIKLFAHGAKDREADYLLRGGLDELYDTLSQECARRGWQPFFVSTWEMFQAIEALRRGEEPAI
jgi:hypothetical protein